MTTSANAQFYFIYTIFILNTTMPILYGPPIQAKSVQEMNDAVTFLKSYKQLYYGSNSDLSGDYEFALALVGYKNYLQALYGLGATSPATASYVVTGSATLVAALATNGYI